MALCLEDETKAVVAGISSGGRVMVERPIVQLVIYDPIRGFLNWMQPRFIEHAKKQCPTTQCLISEDKRLLHKADMVIFHAPTHARGVRRFPPKAHVKSNAIYTLFSMEQPKYAKFLQNTVDVSKNFHLTATYSWKSTYPGTKPPVVNMPLTYYPLNIVPVEEVLKEPLPWEKKDGFGTGTSVVVFVSNCKAAGAAQRLQFLEELMRLIPVHSYGSCLNNRKEPDFPVDPSWPNQRRARKVKIVSRYKFYLAFENLAVPDYVSEKVFEGLFAGAVPVYMGAPEIEKFMPSPDSFINANGWSAQQLAALLNKLSSEEHRSTYEKYFAFKKQELSPNFYDMASNSYCHPNILCRLCEYIAHNVSRSD